MRRTRIGLVIMSLGLMTAAARVDSQQMLETAGCGPLVMRS